VIFGFIPSPLGVDALITSGEEVFSGNCCPERGSLKNSGNDSKHTHPLRQKKILLFSFFLRENRIKILIRSEENAKKRKSKNGGDFLLGLRNYMEKGEHG